jgi:hypothetical protein
MSLCQSATIALRQDNQWILKVHPWKKEISVDKEERKSGIGCWLQGQTGIDSIFEI